MGREGGSKDFPDPEFAKKGLGQPDDSKWKRFTFKETTRTVRSLTQNEDCEPDPKRSCAKYSPFLRCV